jgi:hypothetical protein
MVDIMKAADSSTYQRRVIYDAASNAADVWMRDNYGAKRLEFALLEEVEAMQEFEARAKEFGLTISAEW